MAFDIIGIDNNFKAPIFAGQVLFGTGVIQGTGPRRLLLQGLVGSSATLALDGAPQLCTDLNLGTASSANVLAGSGSLLYRMAKAAMAWGFPLELWLAAVSDASMGVASTFTVTVGGSWTTGGQWTLKLANTTLTGGTSAADTVTTVATAIKNAINGNIELPFTATSSSGVVTATSINAGVTGNLWQVWYDSTQLASGMTIALAGSATNGTHRIFSGTTAGTGVEDITTSLTFLTDKWYARIASSSNDATNIGLWNTQLSTEAGATTLFLEQAIFGHNKAYAAAATLAGVNSYRCQLIWAQYSESHPCEIAAAVAAFRTANEGTNWVPDMDNLAFSMLAPQRYVGDSPNITAVNTALNAGVTPMVTVNGVLTMSRAIVTHCLTGSQPDYRCIDVGDAVVPDNVMMDQQSTYAGWRQANPLVGPDPADGQAPLPPGVGSPSIWTAVQSDRLKFYYAQGFTQDDGTLYPPKNAWNATAQRIQGQLTVVPRRIQHEIVSTVAGQAPQ